MKKTIFSLAFAGLACTYTAQTSWSTSLNSGANLRLGTNSNNNLVFYTNGHESMVLGTNNSLKILGDLNLSENFNINYTPGGTSAPNILSFRPRGSSGLPTTPTYKPPCNIFNATDPDDPYPTMSIFQTANTFADLVQIYDNASTSYFLNMGIYNGDGIISIEPGLYGTITSKLRLNAGCANDVYIGEGGGFTKMFNSAGVIGNLDVSNSVRIGTGTFGLQSSLEIRTNALAKAIKVTNPSLGTMFDLSNTGNGFFSGNLGIGAASPGSKLWVQDATAAEARIHTTIGNAQLVVSNQVGSYAFSIETGTGIGHIGSGTNIINFQNASAPQVWIGKRPTSGPHIDFHLAVDGKLVAKSIYVTLSGNWADYVFEKDYKLLPLAEVEKFYKANKHLPEVPSAAEIAENGIDMAKTDMLLLQKIEELTLYIVEQQKEISALKEDLKSLKRQKN